MPRRPHYFANAQEKTNDVQTKEQTISLSSLSSDIPLTSTTYLALGIITTATQKIKQLLGMALVRAKQGKRCGGSAVARDRHFPPAPHFGSRAASNQQRSPSNERRETRDEQKFKVRTKDHHQSHEIYYAPATWSHKRQIDWRGLAAAPVLCCLNLDPDKPPDGGAQ